MRSQPVYWRKVEEVLTSIVFNAWPKKEKSLKTKKSEAEMKKLIFIKKSVVQRDKAS